MSSPASGRLVRSLSGPLPTTAISPNLTGSRSTDVIISLPPPVGDTERFQFSAFRSVWLTLQSMLSAHNSDVRPSVVSVDDSVTSSLVVRDRSHDQSLPAKSQGDEECGICMETRQSDELRQLRLCGCRFCLECLSRYVEVRIRDGESLISCPSFYCMANGYLTADEVQTVVSNNDFFELFQKLKQTHDVCSNPLSVWCPRPDCDTVCRLADSDATSFACASCGLLWCVVCRRRLIASQPHECRPEQLPMPGDREPGAVDVLVKACPHCGTLIERDEGCAQVLCRLCRHAFCWYCLHSLDGDFLLRHYDRGACRGLLGHSRLSLLWHRVLIVCLVLVLMLSFVLLLPLLLAVSPVIFCCFCCCGIHDTSGAPTGPSADPEPLDPSADGAQEPERHSPSFTFSPMVP